MNIINCLLTLYVLDYLSNIYKIILSFIFNIKNIKNIYILSKNCNIFFTNFSSPLYNNIINKDDN